MADPEEGPGQAILRAGVGAFVGGVLAVLVVWALFEPVFGHFLGQVDTEGGNLVEDATRAAAGFLVGVLMTITLLAPVAVGLPVVGSAIAQRREHLGARAVVLGFLLLVGGTWLAESVVEISLTGAAVGWPLWCALLMAAGRGLAELLWPGRRGVPAAD